MLFRTHLFLVLIIFLYYIPQTHMGQIYKLIFLVLIILGAKLPDIDTTRSKIGRQTRPVSTIINMFFGHRGLFHSIFFIMALSIILLLLHVPGLFIVAFAVGYISHLFLDIFSKRGLRPFWPIKLKIRGPIKTGGYIENAIFLFFILIVVILFIKNLSHLGEMVIGVLKPIF
ncbi:MAG: metal-dependent hydrolase [archaeon]|nr:MAG: metal-dependent hydrolase [archaeon]